MTREIEEQAALFILRREEAGWTAADQEALDNWLAQSMRHKAVYWRLAHGWARIGRKYTAASPPEPRARSTGVMVWLGGASALAAALLAVILLATISLKYDGFVELAQYSTVHGERDNVSLPDGSRIELNTNTSIDLRFTATARIIRLDRGEAYFEVAHDKKRPFIIRSGAEQIIVLGTKFAVRRSDDDILISVLDGKVQLEEPAAAGPLLLRRGDIAWAGKGGTSVTYNALSQVENNLGWRDGLLIFKHMALGDAAAEFNRYNSRQIVITDAEVAAIPIGGSFQAENIDGFTRLLHRAYGLHVDHDGDFIKISQQG